MPARRIIVYPQGAGSLRIQNLSPLPSGTVGTAYSDLFTGAGGVAPYTWSVIEISGTNSWSFVGANLVALPTAAETDTLAIRLQDSVGNNVTGTYTVSIVSGTNNWATNVIGTNLGEQGFAYEGFPLFKNRLRESVGFQTTSGGAITLSAKGWPTGDFQLTLVVLTGAGGGIGSPPQWVAGTYKCGFIGTGSETIGYDGGAGTGGSISVANIVPGTGGAYTTFDLIVTNPTSTAAFGIKVTGTTGGVTNVFCYLPEYPGFGIDNPLSASAFTTEALTYYGHFSHIRWMSAQGMLINTQMGTSSNRLQYNSTTQNWQAPIHHAFDAGISSPGTFTAVLTGATSATITSWPYAAGTYMMGYQNTGVNPYVGGASALWVQATVSATGANAPVTFSSAITTTSTSFICGVESFPIELALSFCKAAGIGCWINTPVFEDGANSAAGTYFTSVLQFIDSFWPTSGAPVIMEFGNENFFQNPSVNFTGMSLAALWTQYGSSYGGFGNFIGYRLHSMANEARSTLSNLTLGNQVQIVMTSQTALTGFYYQIEHATLTYMQSTYGNVSSDISYVAAAPYLSANLTGLNSITAVEDAYLAISPTWANNYYSDKYAIWIAYYGLKFISYEGGDNTYADAGATVSPYYAAQSKIDFGDSGGITGGWQSVMTPYYQGMGNAGYWKFTYFTDGVSTFNNYKGPGYESSVNYGQVVGTSTPTGSPTYNTVSQYFNGWTVTRNVVTTPGTIIYGYQYQDNYGNTTNPTLTTLGAEAAPMFVSGYVSFLVYCASARSSSVVATFSSVTGTPIVQFWCNSTEVTSSISVSNGTVTLGTCSLQAGWNGITIGANNSGQVATLNQLEFN